MCSLYGGYESHENAAEENKEEAIKSNEKILWMVRLQSKPGSSDSIRDDVDDGFDFFGEGGKGDEEGGHGILDAFDRIKVECSVGLIRWWLVCGIGGGEISNGLLRGRGSAIAEIFHGGTDVEC